VIIINNQKLKDVLLERLNAVLLKYQQNNQLLNRLSSQHLLSHNNHSDVNLELWDVMDTNNRLHHHKVAHLVHLLDVVHNNHNQVNNNLFRLVVSQENQVVDSRNNNLLHHKGSRKNNKLVADLEHQVVVEALKHTDHSNQH
jgi:hypothetical protein